MKNIKKKFIIFGYHKGEKKITRENKGKKMSKDFSSIIFLDKCEKSSKKIHS